MGSDRSGCTVFPQQWQEVCSVPSYFFEGIVTYMVPNIVAFRGRVEKRVLRATVGKAVRVSIFIIAFGHCIQRTQSYCSVANSL